MRRKIGLALVGLGVLMLVVAPLLRWYAYPRLAVVPSEVQERVSMGEGVTVLDSKAVAERTEPLTRTTDVQSVRKIIPDLDASTDQVAVWETGLTTVDLQGEGATPGDKVLSYAEERVAFDRHSADSVEGFDQYYTSTGDDADRVKVDHTGYFFKLPFGTEQRDYEFWDSNLQDTRPMEFDGEDQIDGMDVYRFVQTVEPTSISLIEVPGFLFDLPRVVEAERVYANTRTIRVEPQTGSIIDGQEETETYLAYQGTRGPTLIQGTLSYTDDQVSANVAEYSGTADELQLIRSTGPLAAAVGGALLVIAGLLLGRRRYPGRKASRVPDELPASSGESASGSLAVAAPAPAVATAPAVAAPAWPVAPFISASDISAFEPEPEDQPDDRPDDQPDDRPDDEPPVERDSEVDLELHASDESPWWETDDEARAARPAVEARAATQAAQAAREAQATAETPPATRPPVGRPAIGRPAIGRPGVAPVRPSAEGPAERPAERAEIEFPPHRNIGRFTVAQRLAAAGRPISDPPTAEFPTVEPLAADEPSAQSTPPAAPEQPAVASRPPVERPVTGGTGGRPPVEPDSAAARPVTGESAPAPARADAPLERPLTVPRVEKPEDIDEFDEFDEDGESASNVRRY